MNSEQNIQKRREMEMGTAQKQSERELIKVIELSREFKFSISPF
jgi:hypothetical protein